MLVNTKPHTARAASDKFVVEEESTKDKIWWGVYNRPIQPGKILFSYGKSKSILPG